MIDIERFQQASRAYLRRKGRYDEDLLSEMTLCRLDHPAIVVSVKNAYLRAIDRLDPRRRMITGGKKERQSWHTSALRSTDTLNALSVSAEDQQYLDLHRAIAALRTREQKIIEATFFYGETLSEAGTALGLSQARICQLRSQALAKLRTALG